MLWGLQEWRCLSGTDQAGIQDADLLIATTNSDRVKYALLSQSQKAGTAMPLPESVNRNTQRSDIYL